MDRVLTFKTVACGASGTRGSSFIISAPRSLLGELQGSECECAQRMVLTATSPIELAELIERQSGSNSAAAMYDAHTTRVRANAREPMVTIASQGAPQSTADPIKEAE